MTVSRIVNSELEKYKHYTRVFTDGSKSAIGVGAAWTSDIWENHVKLDDNTSIFHAELYAILMALEFLVEKKISKVVVCTDSLSSLKAIQKIRSSDPLVIQIRNVISSSDSKFAFLWIPAHSNITGNERADFLAKLGSEIGERRNTGLTHVDMKQRIKRGIWLAYQELWDSNKGYQKLGEIKSHVRPWKTAHLLNKRDEVIITRLRLGHTRLTHEHLFERREVNKCVCGADISVKHIFTCINLVDVRYRFSISDLETLKLDDIVSQHNVIKYVKAIKYHSRI